MLLTLHSSRECDTRGRPRRCQSRRRAAPRGRPGPRCPAWLVTEDDERWPRPAVLWLHWLGHRHNDRGEFLAARGRARRARCRLAATGGTLPVGPRPGRHRHRRPAGPRPGRRPRGRPRPPRWPSRASTRPGSRWWATTTARCTAPCSPTATSGSRRWRCRRPTRAGRTGSRRTGSSSRATPARSTPTASPTSSPSTPSPGWPAARRPMLLQWAGNDTFVTAEARAAYERANPRARSVGYHNADHMLDDRAARPGRVPRRAAGLLGAKLKHVLVLRPCGSPTPRR